MAKKDLDKLSKSIDELIEKEKNNSRGTLNKQTHIYKVSSETFAAQLARQLVNVRKFSPLTDSEYKKTIEELSSKYTGNLYDSLKTIKVVKIEGGKDNFKARLSSSDHPSPFRAFQLARTGPIDTLKQDVIEQLFDKFTSNKSYIDYSKMSDEDLIRIKNDVKNKSKKVLATPGSDLEKYEMLSSRILGSFREGSDKKLEREGKAVLRSRGMSDLGHVKTLAVNKVVLPVIANAIIEGTMEKQITSLGVKYSIRSSVKKATQGTPVSKTFEIEVEVFDESASQNRGDGSTERKELKEATESIRDKILKEIKKNDWANQESSPSFMRLVKSSLFRSASKIGLNSKIKFQGDKTLLKPMKTSPSEVSKTIKGKKGAEKVVASGKNSKVVPKVATESRTPQSDNQRPNWLQLLPLINAKLTDTVMKNMTSPRLVNRTGRFAQSARVVGVEQTPKGFPSFVFDYERDPYDVFDRTLGRAPWNTPQRDPRALVDTSVREIVREMAIGRFFTRRAQ